MGYKTSYSRFNEFGKDSAFMMGENSNEKLTYPSGHWIIISNHCVSEYRTNSTTLLPIISFITLVGGVVEIFLLFYYYMSIKSLILHSYSPFILHLSIHPSPFSLPLHHTSILLSHFLFLTSLLSLSLTVSSLPSSLPRLSTPVYQQNHKRCTAHLSSSHS